MSAVLRRAALLSVILSLSASWAAAAPASPPPEAVDSASETLGMAMSDDTSLTAPPVDKTKAKPGAPAASAGAKAVTDTAEKAEAASTPAGQTTTVGDKRFDMSKFLQAVVRVILGEETEEDGVQNMRYFPWWGFGLVMALVVAIGWLISRRSSDER